MTNIIDISIPLKPSTVVYPGNPKVEFEEEKGATSVHTKITLGSHAGTHLDAPSHVFSGAQTIDELPLKAFYGPCFVLDMTSVKEKIGVDDIKNTNINMRDKRILFKTKNSIRGFDEFYTDYVYLDGDAAEFLAEQGVAFVGIDYLSIKQKGSSDNRPHTALLEKNIPILETIDLRDVEQGEYILSALPLKLEGLDGSPTRAVLMQ